jgi:hypothetical protein
MVSFEIGTTNYSDDSFNIKRAMSHIETQVHTMNSFALSEPTSKFGWTFFKLAIRTDLRMGIEDKFSDMIQRYKDKNPEEKFTKFMSDYFESRGSNVKVKLLEY